MTDLVPLFNCAQYVPFPLKTYHSWSFPFFLPKKRSGPFEDEWGHGL